MKVRVRFFASLREQLGCASDEVDLPGDASTVGALCARLQARGGAWASALGPGRPLRTAVNMDMAGADAALKAGDEVAFFPPVTGG